MKIIKRSVIELSEYFVPQARARIKLNQNESPYDIDATLKKEIIIKLRKSKWHRYPLLRPSLLIKAISRYTDFPDPGIVIGNGSNEIIATILFAIGDRKDKVITVSPGFAIYPRVAKIIGLEIVDIPLAEDFRFDVSLILKKSKGAKIIILASPNNPTGTALRIEEIREIVKNFRGIFVVDEAYFEFYQKTAQDFINRFKNLIVIRTFSKAFGLAGIRLGYLLARPEMAKQIDKAKLPFSVGLFQQIAGLVMMKNKSYIGSIVEEIIKERKEMFKQLSRIDGIRPIPSYANFILFELKTKPAKEVFNRLYKQEVLVRSFEAPRLKNALRVTIGKPDENQIFLNHLKTIMNERSRGLK